MPEIKMGEYTAEKLAWHEAAYKRLKNLIFKPAPDAEEFRCALEAALAGGFPIDWPNDSDFTLLHYAANKAARIKAGLPQILIDAGADVNVKNRNGNTPLGLACWNYICNGRQEYRVLIDALLEAGTKPELDESWKVGWYVAGLPNPEQQERCDWLDVYIKTWQARGRGGDETPGFDYAL